MYLPREHFEGPRIIRRPIIAHVNVGSGAILIFIAAGIGNQEKINSPITQTKC